MTQIAQWYESRNNILEIWRLHNPTKAEIQRLVPLYPTAIAVLTWPSALPRQLSPSRRGGRFRSPTSRRSFPCGNLQHLESIWERRILFRLLKRESLSYCDWRRRYRPKAESHNLACWPIIVSRKSSWLQPDLARWVSQRRGTAEVCRRVRGRNPWESRGGTWPRESRGGDI